MLKKWSSKKWWELLLAIFLFVAWYAFVVAIIMSIDPQNLEFALGLFALLLPPCHLIVTTRPSHRSTRELPNPAAVVWAGGIALLLWLIIRYIV